MKKDRLFVAGLTLAVLAGGCSRGETDARAREAAAEVRDVTARAGERLGDSWLTTKIQAQYFADNDIKARYINVTTRDGVVTLRGRIENEAARTQALQIARNTDGVREVQDELRVEPLQAGSPPEQTNPDWITTQIQARYFADSDIASRDIGIAVDEGVVTLTGRVDTELEREQAVAIAQDIDGVRRVEDRLVVQAADTAVATSGTAPGGPAIITGADDAEVETSIQAKYFLDNRLKTRDLEVDSRQGVVTLRGSVGSDDERAQALLLARTTAGVDRVEDALAVDASLEPAVGDAAAADAALTTYIETLLDGDDELRSASIRVMAKDGVVLLEGAVPTAADEQRALTLAGGAEGVVEVVDRIEVSSTR